LHQRLLDMGVADDDMMTLNSGVIGLTQQDAHILDHSIELMDELFPHAQGATPWKSSACRSPPTAP